MSSSSSPWAPVLLALLGACAGRASPAPVDPPPPTEAPTPVADPEKPMMTTIQAGLSDVHRGQTPILDRIEDQGRGRMRGTRTYEDGTQYLIVSDPFSPTADGGEPAWSPFVTLTPQGVERVRQVIRESVLTWQGSPPSAAGPSGGGGTITWVVHVDGQQRVVQTASGSYATLPAFVRQLDEAVSQNVQPAQ